MLPSRAGGSSNRRKKPESLSASAAVTEDSHFPDPRRTPKPLGMLEITCLFKRRNEGVRVAGRPASESGISNQGRHATAFSLVKKGFTKWLTGGDDLDDRKVKRRILNYMERLSVLQRLPRKSAALDGRGCGLQGGEDMAAPPDAANAVGLSDELYKCVNDVLQVYSENRMHRRHLRQSKKDLDESSPIAIAMRAQDMEDVLKVVLSSRNGEGGVAKEVCVDRLVELFGSRFSRGDKRAVIQSFEKSLNALFEPLQAEEIFRVVQVVGLDRVSRRHKDIRFQQDANSDITYDTCETLSELSVAYYNRMRGVAFNPADTYEYPPGRVDEAVALRYLDERYVSGSDNADDEEWQCSYVKNLHKSIAIVGRQIARKEGQLTKLSEGDPKRAKLEKEILKKKAERQGDREKLENSPDLTKALDGLFDYPAVRREAGEVAEHSGERDGGIDKLIFLMARHLHIAFNVYPEAVQRYGVDYLSAPGFRAEIVYPFVEQALSRGWPTIDSVEYGSFSTGVLGQMAVFSQPNKKFREVRDEHESSSSDSNPISGESVGGVSGSDEDDDSDPHFAI